MNVGRIAIALVVGLGITSGIFAGRLQKTDVVADAKWVAHIDFELLRTTELHALLDGIPKKEEILRKLDLLEVLFGFNVKRDLKSITAYGRNFAKDAAEGAMILRGNLDREKIESVVMLGEETEVVTYGKYRLIRIVPEQKKGSPFMAAFQDGNTLLFAKTTEQLKRALDVLDGKLDSIAVRNPFEHVDEAETCVLFIAANLAEMEAADDPRLRGVKALTIIASEDEGEAKFTAIADAKTEQEAKRLQRMIDGALAIMEGMAAASPEAAQIVPELISRIQVDSENKRIDVSFGYESDSLFKLITDLKAKGLIGNLKARQQKLPADQAAN